MPENLELCLCQYGEVYEQFEDHEKIEAIEPEGKKVYFIEAQKGKRDKDDPDYKVLELNFSNCSVSKRGGLNQALISNSVPRFHRFAMHDSVIDMKKQVFERIRGVFPDGGENTEEYINTNIILHIKDSTHYDRTAGPTRRKRVCEFCGRRHNSRDDICNVRSAEVENGNDLEGAKKLTLKDLYDQLEYKRDLIIEVMLNEASNFDGKRIAHSLVKSRSFDKAGASGSCLDSCFKAFSTEELLTGNDQWYCNKCKEHRDIHKKLELFKVPKILII